MCELSYVVYQFIFFFFSSRRRHTRFDCDWSSDVCSSDLQMSPQSAEYHVARTYLEVLASLPWSRTSTDRLDLKAAREVLDPDHYPRKTVKERILEYLALRTLNPQARASLPCFEAPPAVAETAPGRTTA